MYQNISFINTAFHFRLLLDEENLGDELSKNSYF